MNKIDFTQPGGFPLDQDVFGFQQLNTFMAGQMAYLGGALCIISGCPIVGANVGDGYVAINGEILPFVGGVVLPKVVIIETTTNMAYADGVSRPSQIERHATFGDDGVTNNLWDDFKRNTPEGVLARLERLERVAQPFTGTGGMVLWNRPYADIPTDWKEVVDWRGRLPMGYDPDDSDFNDVGKTGGAKGVKMKLENLIAHDHDYVDTTYTGGSASGNADAHPDGTKVFTNKKTGKTGSSDPVAMNVVNPFRIVVFIEYIGK